MDIVSLENNLPVVGMPIFSTISHGTYLKYLLNSQKETKERRREGGRQALLRNIKMYLHSCFGQQWTACMTVVL